MMRMGGFCFSMVRICTGEVCVRRRMFSVDIEGVLRIARRVVLRAYSDASKL